MVSLLEAVPAPVLRLDWVQGSARERELERVRDCQLVWKV